MFKSFGGYLHMDGAMGTSEIGWVECVNCKEKRGWGRSPGNNWKNGTIWPPTASCSLPDLVEFHPVHVHSRGQGDLCAFWSSFSGSLPPLPHGFQLSQPPWTPVLVSTPERDCSACDPPPALRSHQGSLHLILCLLGAIVLSYLCPVSGNGCFIYLVQSLVVYHWRLNPVPVTPNHGWRQK